MVRYPLLLIRFGKTRKMKTQLDRDAERENGFICIKSRRDNQNEIGLFLDLDLGNSTSRRPLQDKIIDTNNTLPNKTNFLAWLVLTDRPVL